MTDEVLARYSRQLVLPEVDFAGQERLQAARVGIIGIGGLGNPAALYLAGAGVGFLRLFDHDVIDVSNLHRQIGFRTKDVNASKAKIMARECLDLNPEIQIDCVADTLDEKTLLPYLQDVDVILDATDNFRSRFALNRLAIQLQKPLVMGSAIQWSGQWAVYQAFSEKAPCYACVFPESAQEARVSCSEVGVIGPVAGVVGSMMALNTLQLLLGKAIPPALQHFDGIAQQFKKMRLVKDPECLCCQPQNTLS